MKHPKFSRFCRLTSSLFAKKETKMTHNDTPPQPQGFPPGHFYSPIPNVADVHAHRERIFDRRKTEIPGVDLREQDQLKLLSEFGKMAPSIPFSDTKSKRYRYHYSNPAYSFGDASVLHCMMRHFKPRKLIEIGSGYSSAMALDTNELFLGSTCHLTFIEPYADLLRSLMKPEDRDTTSVIESRLQDVDPTIVDSLEANDILFVDSTHVGKVDSDVNHLFFEFFPRLKPGVLVHIHDVFFPFEYPEKWIYEGRSWNELYMLRTFLQYNDAFKITFFNHYLYLKHRSAIELNLPVFLNNPGGAFWMTRIFH